MYIIYENSYDVIYNLYNYNFYADYVLKLFYIPSLIFHILSPK